MPCIIIGSKVTHPRFIGAGFVVWIHQAEESDFAEVFFPFEETLGMVSVDSLLPVSESV